MGESGRRGSGITVYRFPFAYNTPHLYDTGVDVSSVYVPKAGDAILAPFIRLVTPWDGQLAYADFGPFTAADAGFGSFFGTYGQDSLTAGYADFGVGGHFKSNYTFGVAAIDSNAPLILWAVNASTRLYTPDGSKTPAPFPTQGAAELVLPVQRG